MLRLEVLALAQNQVRVSEFVSLGYIECSVGQILAEGRGAIVKVSQALIKLSCKMFNEVDFEFSPILSGIYGHREYVYIVTYHTISSRYCKPRSRMHLPRRA